jgi:hypothetical protein
MPYVNLAKDPITRKATVNNLNSRGIPNADDLIPQDTSTSVEKSDLTQEHLKAQEQVRQGFDVNTSAIKTVDEMPEFNLSNQVQIEGIPRTLKTTYREYGKNIEVEYEIVDLASIATSHTPDGVVNPDYPQEAYQPRDRSSVQSINQIREYANNLNPDLLIDSPSLGIGTPLITRTGIVVAGNGRANALRVAYQDKNRKVTTIIPK